MVEARIGPIQEPEAEASPGLLGASGLVWRLQRGAFVGWAVGMLGFGLILGAISEQITDTGGPTTVEWYARMGGTKVITDAWQVAVVEMAGMAVAVYVVQILLRMRAQEAEGTLEPVLAASVSRPRWVMSHVLNAGLGAVGLLLVFAVAMGLAAGSVLGDTLAQLRALIGAGVVQLPAVMVLGAVVIALIAWMPRWAGPVSWAMLMSSVLVGPIRRCDDAVATTGARRLSVHPHPQGAGSCRHCPTHRRVSGDRGSPRRGGPAVIPSPQPCPSDLMLFVRTDKPAKGPVRHRDSRGGAN